MKVTIFDASPNRKVPISPYKDKTFTFRTREVRTHQEFLNVIGKYFILNQPLKNVGEEYDIRTTRRISTLKSHYSDTFDYIILDVDDVNTAFAMQKILEYFKDYKCILGESYSHNGFDNFRLKGVLFCEEGSIQDIQISLKKIRQDLQDYCSIDTSRGFFPSFNAPSKKSKSRLNNENGKLWEHSKLLAPVLKTPQNTQSPQNLQQNLKVNEAHTLIQPNYNEAGSINEICLMYFEFLGFKPIEPLHDGFVKFKHPSEIKTIGGFSWHPENPFNMIHWNEERSVNIFQDIQKIPKYKELLMDSLDYDSELLSYNPNTKLIKVNQRYLEATDKIKESIQEFLELEKGLFSIRSPMGTGKSTIIKEIITEAQDAGLRVLVLTNRISVAEDFEEKYDLVLYSSGKYKENDSLICQFDSLWKYNLRNFDLVVMDEFISLMTHARSDLNNSALNIIKFFGAFNKKLVIADAFLTGYERFLLSDKVDKSSYLLDNDYRDSTSLFQYECKNNFTLKLLHTARKHKITVSSTSLRFIEDVRSLLQSQNLRTVTLTAETPDTTKKLIYDLFQKDTQDNYDVLLFSPTLTVGVSNLNDINYHFHYDSSMSADVISSIQMIKRTRKSKQIHFYVNPRMQYLKTDYNALRKEYVNNVGRMGDFSVFFSTNDYGEIQLTESGKKAIQIDIFKNILELNHKKAFLWLLKYHFKNPARVIEKRFGANILSKHTKENVLTAKTKQYQSVQEFLNLTLVDIAETENTTIQKLSSIFEELELEVINKTISPTPNELKSLLLNEGIKRGAFITECKYFNLFKRYCNKELSTVDIQYKMQDFISKDMTEEITFCRHLLKTNIKFSTTYEIKEFVNPSVKYVLEKSGYKKESRLGHRLLGIPDTIERLSFYIRDF